MPTFAQLAQMEDDNDDDDDAITQNNKQNKQKIDEVPDSDKGADKPDNDDPDKGADKPDNDDPDKGSNKGALKPDKDDAGADKPDKDDADADKPDEDDADDLQSSTEKDSESQEAFSQLVDRGRKAHQKAWDDDNQGYCLGNRDTDQ